MFILDLSISCDLTPSSQPQALWQNPTLAVITLLSLAYQDFQQQEYKGARALWITNVDIALIYAIGLWQEGSNIAPKRGKERDKEGELSNYLLIWKDIHENKSEGGGEMLSRWRLRHSWLFSLVPFRWSRAMCWPCLDKGGSLARHQPVRTKSSLILHQDLCTFEEQFFNLKLGLFKLFDI